VQLADFLQARAREDQKELHINPRLLLLNSVTFRPKMMVFDFRDGFSTMTPENQTDINDRFGTFQEKTVPPNTRLAGWAWLVRTFGVAARVRRPSAISDQHVKASFREAGEWTIFDKRYWPGETFGDQLGFALRHENLELLVLKRIFEAVPQDTVVAFVHSAPTGAPSRHAWFLYEFLTGRTLDIEDAAEAGFTDLPDSQLYFTAAPVLSRHHKVRNNLLGNRDFCPIIP
jgi:hypothetical protein